MAQISPFRALRYDPARVSLSQVATQPYDKITPQMREDYYASSPNNLVRIILGKPESADDEKRNVYTRAAGFFSDWRKQGVFLQDTQPSIYTYVERFTAPRDKAEQLRRGFIALGRLEDYSAGIVHRHEQTLAKPKADRLDLLRHTKAHFGQIFMLYSDPGAEIEGALATDSKPDLEMRDEYGVLHQVWKVSSPQLIDLVRAKMRDKKLIIADGHHRYETALAYRNERRAEDSQASRSQPADAPHEFVMMTLVNMDSPGLLILPTHRVVHGLRSFSAEALREAARLHFSVEEVDPSLDAARATAILREGGSTGTALLGITANRAFLFDRPRGDQASIFGGLSLRQQSLDVVQLHKCLLEGALGLSEESIRNQENISYIRDTDEAMARVRDGRADVAFLMNPARMHQIRDIAFGNEVLPQKSTDFYPKLLSGLTVYALE
jgi:uncharacterized protein (DUF1015 family)